LLSNHFFQCGNLVVNHAWKLLILSTILTIIGTIKIPLSNLSNAISDFTPLDAPSYLEYQAQQNFFDGGLQANTIYAFVTAKDGGSMYTVPRMAEAIRVLDLISSDFKLNTTGGEVAFDQFCRAFCVINEPVRTFFNGMRLMATLGDNATTVNMGYPDTTVMGVRSHMDPNIFGVKIVINRNGRRVIVPTSDAEDLNTGEQLHNNLRDFKMVVFNFKSEFDPSISKKAIEKWEHDIVRYFQRDFNSSLIGVRIYAESFITSEVVRSGLSLLPFLVIGFIIMVSFSATSFCVSAIALNQLAWNKMWLAFFACATPFMACGVGLGGMLFVGMRFGTILCVTPFLILAIGVDDAYLMVNAWQQITNSRRREDLRGATANSELLHRTKEMLIETGPSIAITTITNVAAFAISAVSGAPEIQLFSVGNAVCVLLSFVFQLTVYGSVMVILGRKELAEEFTMRGNLPEIKNETEKEPNPLDATLRVDEIRLENRKKKDGLTTIAQKMLRAYCELLSNRFVVAVIMIVVAIYLVIAFTGTMRIKAELRPERLFLRNSPFTKLFADRQDYIIPHYSVAWIYVLNPGDIYEPNRRALIDSMVHDFETLPQSVGKYSTKLWMREYDEFARVCFSSLIYCSSEPAMTRFVFTTAYKGEELRDWSNRATLLKQWRDIAKTYSALNVTVYQDDSKFLDIIETMVPQSMQSALLTFASMFVVACLFIPAPLVLFTATFTILSTSLGVFGFMAWIGTELDPILMSATIMSIGFSVDIPAHIAYHYHQTKGHFSTVVDRLEHTISRVGFPIAQASLSTILCVSSLFFVELHMSTIFASTMLCVVIIGTIHGLFVMPAIFSAFTLLSQWAMSGLCARYRTDSINITSSSSSNTNSSQPSNISSNVGSTTIMVQ
ncbi:hypothetical protein PFISCL1PPCAC_6620, partial [Pristionchus fissidentatus]